MKPHIISCRTAVLALLLGLAWPVSAGLVHRYSFTTDARDSVGTANGVIAQKRDTNNVPMGSPVTFGDGQATLDGVGGYIDLPNGLVSSLTNITIEAWVTWNGSAYWERIFDFGNNDKGEDIDGSKVPATAQNYMFLTPQSAATAYTRFAITDGVGGGAERPVLTDTVIFPLGEVHVAVTYGPAGANLYVGGILVSKGDTSIPLSSIQDTNNWLGRANWNDPLFLGTFNEFRIHDVMRTSQEIAASSTAGPDSVGYDAGTISALTVTAPATMLVSANNQVQLRGTFSVAGDVALSGTDVTLTSSDTNVVEVTKAGFLRAKASGDATITATLGGQTATATITVFSLVAELKNRYSFSEPAGSTTIKDSVGGADGTAYPGTNAATVVGLGNGQADFPAVPNYQAAAYIALPGGLISSKNDITLETWFTWRGPTSQSWQRVFDLGNSGKANGDPHNGGNGLAYFFLTPRSGGNTLRFVGKPDSAGENPSLNTTVPAMNQQVHVVCVYSPQLGYSRIYVDGLPKASGATPFQLSALSDPYCWLGVSLYNDPPFNGSINEFRVYEGALSDLDVALHTQAGPDTIPNPAGPMKNMSLTVPTLLYGNPTAAQATLIGNFETVSNLNISAVFGVTYVSGNTNIFTVDSIGQLKPGIAGTASLIASFSGQSATSMVSVVMPTALRIGVSELYAGGVTTNLAVLADFPGSNNVNVIGFTNVGASVTSSVPTVASASTNGAVNPIKAGTTQISATYAGLTVQSQLTVVLPPDYKKAELIHRYSFSEQPGATTVEDLVGTADGTVVNSTGTDFTGTGQLNLTGGASGTASSYVNLPNGLVSSLTNSGCTIEGWVTWNGPADQWWSRVFDFGRNSAAEEDQNGNPGVGYMFFTPYAGTGMRFAIKQGTSDESPVLDALVTMAVGTQSHFAVVYDWPSRSVRFYYNGQFIRSAAATLNLNVVEDRNVWLGRSQWTDSFFGGSYNEFRIYEGVLNSEEVAASFTAGADATITPTTETAPTLSASRIDNTLVLTWPASAAGFTLQTVGILGTPWAPVGVAPMQDGTNMKLLVSIGTSNAFFQLKK